MPEKTLEAIVASPPDRDDLVVQLFVKDGGQWGEVFQEDDRFRLELYQHRGKEIRRLVPSDLTEPTLAEALRGFGWELNPTEALLVVKLAVKELIDRQE